MDIEEIREVGLGLPFATERCPFGPDTLALEIGGKMFCLIDLSGEWQFYNLKVDPEYSIELQDRYPEVRPGYHMNKRHWISVILDDSMADADVLALIEDSYALTHGSARR